MCAAEADGCLWFVVRRLGSVMQATVYLALLLAGLTTLSANSNIHIQKQEMQQLHANSDDIDEFVPLAGQRFDTFDWRLCTAIARANPGNVVMSPISIKLLLKMLYEGSTGMSSDELARTLDLPRDKTVSRLQSSSILRSLQAPNPDYKMEIGSKIFITENVSPKNWYQRILYLYYNAFIEKLDFSDPAKATERINNWVQAVTHDQIKDFLSAGDGLESTIILLVNAIYFKGTWRTPFAKGDTYPGKFHTPTGLRDVQYMTQSNYFYYSRSERLRSQILRLPYLGQKFSMYIILPERKNGLDELIRTINPADLRKHIWLLEETSLEVILPKFQFDYKTELKDVMKELGIRKLFETFNDMKGLTKNNKVRDLVVSNVIQKAAIDVNEEGSIAAAATEFQLINKFGGSDEIFNASHPFLFFIEDESTGTIVFIGKFIYPAGYNVTTAPTTTTSTTTPAPAKTMQNHRRVPALGFHIDQKQNRSVGRI